MRDRRRGGLGPQDDGDAELGARLDAALREGLGSQHVDVAQLLRQTRRASRRARVQRRVLVAVAAAAVAAVPVSYGLLEVHRPVRGSSAASGTDTLEPTGTPSGTPAPSPTSGGTPSEPPTAGGSGESGPARPPVSPSRSLKGPEDVLFPIPDEMAFDEGELPSRMTLTDDMGHYRFGPTAWGQGCGSVPERRRPLSRRTWDWADETSKRRDQLTVTLVVTGWNDSEAAFAALTDNSGACRFIDEVHVSASTDTEWSASMTSDGLSVGVAARRLPGDILVAVTVYHPKGTEDALLEAERLVQIAAAKAVDTGLTAR